jgi:hypothetical protein
MCRKQNNSCAICGSHCTQFINGLVIDHDHATGKVRGLLCSRCNIGLGCYHDDIELMKRAIQYLERNKSADCAPQRGDVYAIPQTEAEQLGPQAGDKRKVGDVMGTPAA